MTKALTRARRMNLKLNKEKSQIGLEEISYIGHTLSKESLKPDPKKTRAINEMKESKNVEEQ